MSIQASNTPGDPRSSLQKHPLNICIASPDFIGAAGGGSGAGMAYTTMAQALAAAGHQVTCLFLGVKTAAADDWEKWVSKYKRDGLVLTALPTITGSDLVAPTHLIRSYEAYQWLKRHDRFDIIHFPDQRGPGYHTLTAKHHGIAFGRATICIGLHSMTSWLKAGHPEDEKNPGEVDTEFMERRAVALADAVVSPSHYLLNWISDRNWEMPRHRYVQHEIVAQTAQPGNPREAARLQSIQELVYLGSFEAHKGILLFCDALDAIPSAIAGKIRNVTFFGTEHLIEGLPAEAYLKKRAQPWRFPFTVITNLDDPGTMEYLRQKDRLAVIPSLLKNSPYKVHECLAAGIAFVASRIGGVPELIASEDVSQVCFEPNSGALSLRLSAALTEGVRPARPMIDALANQQSWIALHEKALVTQASVRPAATAQPALPAPDLSDEAVRAAVQALSIDPNDSVALKALARIHLNAGCLDAAREACHLILKGDGSDAEALAMLGEADLSILAVDKCAPPVNTNAAGLTAAFV